MCSKASLDVDDTGGCCRLGFGKNLELLQYDANYFSKAPGDILRF